MDLKVLITKSLCDDHFMLTRGSIDVTDRPFQGICLLSYSLQRDASLSLDSFPHDCRRLSTQRAIGASSRMVFLQ